MSPAESLSDGACMDLPPEVLDKYFFANSRTHPFEHITAKAICGGCAVRAACLLDAVESPGIAGTGIPMIRGGEPGWVIRFMRRQHFLNGVPVQDLVMAALDAQDNKISVGSWRALREGRFNDMELVLDSGDDS